MMIRNYCAILISNTFLFFFSIGAHARDYDGAQLYTSNCSICHGTYGAGDGVVSPALSVVLMDLRYLSARNSGVFPESFVLKVIDGRSLRVARGLAGMPVWGVEFLMSEGYGDAAQKRVADKVQALADFLTRI